MFFRRGKHTVFSLRPSKAEACFENIYGVQKLRKEETKKAKGKPENELKVVSV